MGDSNGLRVKSGLEIDHYHCHPIYAAKHAGPVDPAWLRMPAPADQQRKPHGRQTIADACTGIWKSVHENVYGLIAKFIEPGVVEAAQFHLHVVFQFSQED